MRTRNRLLLLLICLTLLAPGAFAQSSRRTVRVGYFHFAGYHEQSAGGERSGYGYELLQRMAQYTDWQYEYVGYENSWSDMLDMLDRGQIDLVTSAQKTEERLQRFDFSSYPVGVSATCLFARADDTRYHKDGYEGFSGMRVGMISGNTRNDDFAAFAKEKGFTYMPVGFHGSEDMEKALADAQIDAIVTSNLRSAPGEHILAEFNVSPFYVIVKKGNARLLEQINQAIEQVNLYHPSLASELNEKYYAISTTALALTAEEKRYVDRCASEGRAFAAILKPDRAPLSYFENGKPGGIVYEIASELSRRTGLAFTYLSSDTASDYMALSLDPKTDLRLDTSFGFSEAEEMGYRLTSDYLPITFSRLSLADASGEPKSVAALLNSQIAKDYLEGAYSQIVYYETVSECVDAVLQGRQDAAFVNTYSAENRLLSDETNRLAITYLPDYSASLRVAIRADADPLLYSIVNKAVVSLGKDYISDLISEYAMSHKQTFSLRAYLYQHPAAVVLLLAVCCAAAIAIILLVNRAHAAAQRERSQRELARFIGYICEANVEITEYNLKSNERRRYAVLGDELALETGDADLEEMILKTHEDDREKIRLALSPDALAEMIADQRGEAIECRMLSGDGEYRWYAVTLQSMRVSDEHPLSFMLYRRDVDRQRKEDLRKSDAIKDALEQARRANRAKSDFLSRMSHEIRTPLNAIIGYTTLSEDATNNPAQMAQYIQKTQIASRHLLSIINDVLDMSSIESGKIKLLHEPFDFKALITGVCDMHYQLARQKGVVFDTKVCEPESEWLIGDSLRLNQILLNLLSNAIKFTKAGGRVTLTVTQTAKRAGEIFLRFDVADTGSGMTKEFMSRVFQPFEQQDASVSREHGGTGLGLSITKNLVDMMHGTISLRSELGVGSTFTVELPFGLDKQNREEAYREFQRVRALIVDDDQSACEYLSLMMTRCKIHNQTALSGREAVEKLDRARREGDPFSICLIDWKMPEMDGMETIRTIRQGKDGNLPIIVVSAYDTSGIEAEAKREGVTKLIRKPVFQSTLFDMLVTLYGSPAAPKDSAADSADYDFTGKTMLLAEDNEMNMEIATAILKRAGFAVTQARDGREALDLFIASPVGGFDVIVLDVMMPEMDGLTAARAMRELDRADARAVPIIAMTANAFSQDVSIALAAGMNDHVAKPIDVGQLYATLAKHLKM